LQNRRDIRQTSAMKQNFTKDICKESREQFLECFILQNRRDTRQTAAMKQNFKMIILKI
jgi:hypothetical protein